MIIRFGFQTRCVTPVLPDGTVIMRAKKHSLLELHGALYRPDRRALPMAKLKR